jgi:hypothetical protein
VFHPSPHPQHTHTPKANIIIKKKKKKKLLGADWQGCGFSKHEKLQWL